VPQDFEKSKSKIKLNVGGEIFMTSKTTLLSQVDSYFYAMLNHGNWLPDEEGEYFIDRNPAVFDRILDYLRDGKLDETDLSDREKNILENDLEYYCLNKIQEEEDYEERTYVEEEFYSY